MQCALSALRYLWRAQSLGSVSHVALGTAGAVRTRTTAAALVERAAASSRGMATRRSRAHGLRLRYGGGVPGVRYGGKLSTEMRYRSESILESVRTPKPAVNPVHKWRIVRGDFVQVTSGPERGLRGRVLEVVRANNRVIVEGVGIVRKYVPQPDSTRKTVVRTEAPVVMSRVQLICPETNKPTRVGIAFLEDGTKVRVAKRSGAIIPRPANLSQRRVPLPNEAGPKDTAPSVVMKRTFEDENDLYTEKYGSFKALIDATVPSASP
jgi:large subunit ribosomal protein L24